MINLRSIYTNLYITKVWAICPFVVYKKTYEKERCYMMNVLVTLLVVQLGMIFFKRTLVGKLTTMIFKTTYKLIRTILSMDYSFVCKIYRIIANQNKQHKPNKKKQQKQAIKKAVGSEINETNYENVVDFKKYQKKNRM
jgi:hypothetical protein